ncbi:hypothetical protein [Pantanalinema sp. GBBB05]|uniref:hypothetical protein n=1 Tax=Pantanalinema sp. GBBB05 TaxID=2604139 RepID=UPI001D22148E|nr:hypothetical protein [Pantanalinema sp. GBBB05]
MSNLQIIQFHLSQPIEPLDPTDRLYAELRCGTHHAFDDLFVSDQICVRSQIVGQSKSAEFCCGLDWEARSGWEFLEGMQEDLAELFRRQLVQVTPGKQDVMKGCSFLTLWEYTSGKDQDTWQGPGDYYTDIAYVGVLNPDLLDKALMEVYVRE